MAILLYNKLPKLINKFLFYDRIMHYSGSSISIWLWGDNGLGNWGDGGAGNWGDNL